MSGTTAVQSDYHHSKKLVDTTTTTPSLKPNPRGVDTIFSEFDERYSNHDSVIFDFFSGCFNLVPDTAGTLLFGNNYSRSADSGIFGGLLGLGRSLIGNFVGGLFGGGTTPTGSGHINPNCPKHSTRFDADVLGRLKPTYLSGNDNLVYVDPNTGKQVDAHTALAAARKLGVVSNGKATTFVDGTTADGVDGKQYVVKDGKWALKATETASDGENPAPGGGVQPPAQQAQKPAPEAKKPEIEKSIEGDFHQANNKGVVANPANEQVYQNVNGKYYVYDSATKKYSLATGTIKGKLYIDAVPHTGPNGKEGYYHDGIKLEQKSEGDVKYFTKTADKETSYYHEVNGKIVPYTGKLTLNGTETLILQGKPAAKHEIKWVMGGNDGYKKPAGEIANLIEGLKYEDYKNTEITIGPEGSAVTVKLLENGEFVVTGSDQKPWVVKKDGTIIPQEASKT